MEAVKTLRANRKGAITKHLSALKRLIAERDAPLVTERLKKLKGAFLSFEEAHDEFHALLTEPAHVADSDQYFLDVEHEYTEGVEAASKWLGDLNVSGTKVVASSEAYAVSHNCVCPSDFTRLINAPHVNLDVFRGDPLEYQNFMSVFDESGDSNLFNDQQKLTR